MTSRRLQSTAVAALGTALMSLAGCSEDPVVPAAACAAEDVLDGVCVGAPAKVCDSDPCTQDVSCESTTLVGDDAALSAALASAGPGSCIALSPGSYGEVQLPGGVSLLGRSAGLVQVAKLTMGAGAGATVRGLEIGGGGLTIDGATGAVVEAVRVKGAAAEGVIVAAGSSVELEAVTVAGAARYGVRVDDGAEVTLLHSIVAGGEGPGVWAACAAGCGCVAAPKLGVTSSIVRDNRLAGIALFAAEASLLRVDVLRTRVGDTWHFGEGGGGISAAQCSTLTARATRVHDSKSFGVLVDDSTALLGGPDTGDALEVSNNLRGIWMQNIGQGAPASVELENVVATDNGGVGLGIGGASVGIFIICKTAVTGTKMVTLPVFENAMDLGTAQQVGDGFEWLGGAEIAIDGLTLSGNARASLVIDGPAAGSLANVTLAGGDEQKGIVQQSVSAGDEQPQTGTAAPAITTSSTEQFAVAKPPLQLAPVLD
jgi:hypothetical protein